VMKPGKRNYKDSLFRDIFNDPLRLPGLYQALEGSAASPDEIKLAGIDETLFSGIKNDVSFFVRDRHVILAEHQSTINANMPLRLAMYLMEIYRQYIPADAVYRRALISLPAPRCYVLYNGEAEIPDRQMLRLSEAFGRQKSSMELEVEIININDAPKRDILERCHELKSYSVFIAKVRESVNHGSMLKSAVIDAVEYCIKNDYLRDYFRKKYKEEVFDMLNFAWDQERALQVRAEEAMEIGMEKGLEKGRQEGKQEGLVRSIRNLMENLQWTPDKAMDALSVPPAERSRYKAIL